MKDSELMSRPKRIQVSGLIRHVMARGNGRMTIFLDDTDYRWFGHLLGDVVEEHALQCFSYCLMPNHYHLTLCPTKANLSEAIRCLNGVYAQWWNKRHSRVGHVFQGRFKDQIVQREGYLRSLCRYVALNPVRAGLAGLPEEWPWSSYGATVGLRPPIPFVAMESVLAQFGEEDSAALQQRFAAYVIAGQGDDECTEDRIRSNERTLGNSAFKVYVRQATEPIVGSALKQSDALNPQAAELGA